ncbi:MAG: hypothetical protein HY232_03865 [Acidobacteria bacterium]|nr:hypothetical protein [Acidobacteriota bacterium]
MIGLGIAIGVSPQRMVFGILLVPLLLWWKIQRREIKPAMIGISLLAGTCLVWFVPLLQHSGGIHAYIKLLQDHSKTVSQDPGYLVMQSEMSLANFIQTKLCKMWGDAYLAVVLAGLGVLGVIVYVRRGGPRKALLLLGVAFLPWIVVEFLWLHIGYPRYSFYWIVLISFFVVYGLFKCFLHWRVWKIFFAPLAVLSLVAFSAGWTLPVVRYLHANNAPAVRLFDYIRQNLNAKTDLIIFDPWLEGYPSYYLPEFVTFSQEVMEDTVGKDKETLQNMNWYYIGVPDPAIENQVKFLISNDIVKTLEAMCPEVALAKTNVLYCEEFGSKAENHLNAWPILKSEAHSYLKNNGRSKILVLRSELLSSLEEPVEISLELDGKLLDTGILPAGRFDRFFILKGTSGSERPFSTLMIRATPYNSERPLVVNSLRWWDIELPSEPHAQIIDSKKARSPF